MKFLFTLITFLSVSMYQSFSQTSEINELNELIDFLMIEGHSTGSVAPDTNLVLNQVYIPAYKSSYQNVFTGNIGTASFNLIREPSYDAFLDWGINHYDDYKLENVKRSVILKQKPYSRVNYLIGSKKEQMLNVTHQQHITKNMIAGLDFLTQASNGFYSDQLSKQRSFDVFYFMHSNNNKYKLLASYTSNKHEAQENGGIVNDTLFIDQADSRDAEESLVNLLSAKSLNKDNTYFLKQKLELLSNGSVNNINDSLIQNGFSISLSNESKYTRKVFVFTESDVDTSFFSSIYYDSVSTYDSSFVSEIVNKFGIEFNKSIGTRTELGFEVFTNYNQFNLFQNNIDTSISTLDLGIASSINKNEVFEFLFEGLVAISDELKESFVFNGFLHFNISENLKGESSFSFADKPGSIIFKQFDSNHFKWTNDFKSEKISTFDATIGFKEIFKIGYNNKNYSNYLYFDSLATPQQFNKDINISKIEISHAFHFKGVNYNGITSYNTSSIDNIIPVPEVQLYHSFYYEDKLFKVGLPMQIGIDFRYHTKYFAQAYMPATGQRYVQAKQEIGGYLFADFFFNFRINNSKIFFKVDHLNEGFAKRNYFIMPYHPLMGRSYKLGIKWLFFD